MEKSHLFIFLITAFIIISLLSCEEKTSWELEKASPVIVVDALITNELKSHHIQLSTSFQELNGTPQMLSGAGLEIAYEDSSYQFTESTLQPGHYYSEPFRAVAGKRYRLTLQYKNFSDTAFALMTGISPLKELITQKNNLLYKYVYTGSSQPAMTEIYYNWSHLDTFCTYYGACNAMETYYTLSSIDISEEFGPEKQIIRFPAGTKIIRRKYSLSDAHQRFIRSLLLETEWRGGLFDVEQGNVPTNFKHSTRGWFACCTVLTDSLIVQ